MSLNEGAGSIWQRRTWTNLKIPRWVVGVASSRKADNQRRLSCYPKQTTSTSIFRSRTLPRSLTTHSTKSSECPLFRPRKWYHLTIWTQKPTPSAGNENLFRRYLQWRLNTFTTGLSFRTRSTPTVIPCPDPPGVWALSTPVRAPRRVHSWGHRCFPASSPPGRLPSVN